MKFRMLILAVLVMVFAATSFGQSNANFLWAQGFNSNWTPLTYCDTGDYATTILAEGTVCILKKSPSPFAAPNPLTDPDAVIGHNGAAGEVWPTNEIIFNTPAGSDAPGFYATSYLFEGGTPGAFDLFYIVVCCDDGEGGCVPMLYSSRFSIPIGYGEIMIGAADPVLGYTGFQRVDCCTPPGPDCTPSADWHFDATGMYYHGDEDYYPENVYFCLDICTDHTINLEIGPLAANEYPVINFFEGCLLGFNGCDVECPPATFIYDANAWVHGQDNMWTNTVVGLSDGCICLELDDILPAELLGFSAKAGDREVELNWTTGSETDIDGFEVVRDGNVVHFADAGAGSYTWMDSDLSNGRTYSYELVSVSIAGTRTVVGTTEATPSFNAATITEYALHQNFPNPFNPTTSIVFDVVEDNHVTLTVYNAMGQEVSTLVNGMFGNGRHNVEFSSDNLTSGLYFYTVKIGNEFTATKKMLLVK